MDVPPIVTERLRLLSMSPEFLEAILGGRRDEASAVVGVALPPGFPDASDRVFRMRYQQMRADPGAQRWLSRLIVRRGERVVVGDAGFHGPPDGGRAVEVGYEVLPQHRRRGYAVEAVTGLLDWARQEHGIFRFRASVSPYNVASLAVIGKLGFVQTGSQMDDVDGLELVFELNESRAGGV